MQLKSLDFFFETFAEEQMNLLYSGHFNDDLTDNLIELNNNQLSKGDEYKKSQRKAGFLIAECFQNIVRHNDLSKEDSFFHIKNNKGLFSLVSGNAVKNDMIPSLQGQLEQLNQLTSDELKEMYRKTLADGDLSSKGGAGLGLIEMARKTKNKLTFTFSEIDAIKSYFYFQLQLKNSEFVGSINANDFNNSIDIRNKMINDKLFLIYKGVISTPVTIALLGMIENSIKQANQKVVFVRFMGLAEKISGLIKDKKKEGSSMLFIGEDEKFYNIGVNILATESEAFSVKRITELYKSCDNDFLEKHYINVLNEQGEVDHNKYALDIIEILRNSSSLESEISSHSEGLSVLTLIMKFKKRRRSLGTADELLNKNLESINSLFSSIDKVEES